MADKNWNNLWKNTWDIGTAYTVGDFCNYLGSSYTCIANSTGNLPTDTDYWALIADKGDTGAIGATGPQGEKGDKGDTGASGNIDTTTTTDINGVITGNGSVIAGKTNPTGAFVGDTDEQVLTNKTLTSPVINNPTGITQDDVGDGTTYKQYSSTEKTKLSGIATGATANTKATGAEIDTGTDDTKFATAKALKDAGIFNFLINQILS